MRIIAVLNQKGGVGKTTTVVNTAAALANLGMRVAALDLDPQAHLTIHLGLDPETIEAGSYKVLTQSADFEGELRQVRPNLWLLPANINLVGAESELVSVVGRETILREAISQARDKFDYMIIDCAPSLGLLTLNALAAAEEILIPLQPHFLALQGFGKLLQTVELVNKRINPNLRVKGILLCMFDSRASLMNEVKADIEQFLSSARGTNCAWSQAEVLPVCIRRNIKLAEAPSYGKTIFEYEPACNGAEDYRKVAEFIHNQTKPKPPEPQPQVSAEPLEPQQTQVITEPVEPEQQQVSTEVVETQSQAATEQVPVEQPQVVEQPQQIQPQPSRRIKEFTPNYQKPKPQAVQQPLGNSTPQSNINI